MEAEKPRRAVVYRGPASLPGCPEAVADLLRQSRWGFDVTFVGPRESHRLSRRALTGVTLYAQPGGGELDDAYRRLRRRAQVIRDYVHAGGRYLGFCLGGYLAGETPGFGLLPGDADQYIRSPGAGTSREDSTVIRVWWGGRPREVFFQDGPYFLVDPARGSAEVIAEYENGLAAALVARCGDGAVGVAGPHPEATSDWFVDVGLAVPDPPSLDLGLELVDRLMTSSQ